MVLLKMYIYRVDSTPIIVHSYNTRGRNVNTSIALEYHEIFVLHHCVYDGDSYWQPVCYLLLYTHDLMLYV